MEIEKKKYKIQNWREIFVVQGFAEKKKEAENLKPDQVFVYLHRLQRERERGERGVKKKKGTTPRANDHVTSLQIHEYMYYLRGLDRK